MDQLEHEKMQWLKPLDKHKKKDKVSGVLGLPGLQGVSGLPGLLGVLGLPGLLGVSGLPGLILYYQFEQG